MMKRYIYFLAAAILTLTGCIKDETTKEFAQLELPVLNNPDKNPDLLVVNHSYLVKFGETLKITPAIEYSDMDDLSYVWKINNEVVSQEKDLVWTCDLERGAIAALYVKRESAGNSVIFKFSIELDRPYERGWVLATDQGGKVVYNFLQEIIANPYRYVEYPEALRTDSDADSWLDCMEFWSNESSAVYGHMLNLDSDPEKCFSVEEVTMLPTVSLKKEFIGEEFPAGVRFTDALYAGYVAYLKGNDGKLYFRKSQKGYYTGRFSSLPVKYEGEDLIVSALIPTSYSTGAAFVYDETHQRFLMIENAYNQDARTAGRISELPESDLSKFKGEEILYARLIKPAWFYMTDYRLFLVSKNRQSGAVTASEYVINMEQGVISDIEEAYFRKTVEGLGSNSVITVLDSPNYGMNYIYYTDSDNPKILYAAKRGSREISDIKVYGTFPGKIISIDQGVISRTTKTIGIAMDNQSFWLLNLSANMDAFTAPSGEENNSLTYEWDNIGGNILKADFRYGKISLY